MAPSSLPTVPLMHPTLVARLELDNELKVYEAHRQEYLQKYKNLYVLIKGNSFIGVFPDAVTAHQAGVSKFGMEPFLVKQVLEEEPINVAPIASLLVSARL